MTVSCDNIMKIILLGAPGSGKGSLAKQILDAYDLAHISVGDLFREAIKKEDDLAKEIKSLIGAGQLVPDSITNQVAKNAILKACAEKNGFILDGYPRTLAQAEFLKEVSDIDYVLYFDIDTEKLVNRIVGRRLCSNCGAIYNVNTTPKPKVLTNCDLCNGLLIQRKDDNQEVALKRIEIYNKETKPLIDFYKKENKLVVLDANLELDSLVAEVKKLLVS